MIVIRVNVLALITAMVIAATALTTIPQLSSSATIYYSYNQARFQLIYPVWWLL